MKVGDTLTLTIGGIEHELVVKRVRGTPQARQLAERLGLVEPLNVHFKVGGRRVRIGDQVRVLPSAKGKRDGYIATLRHVKTDDDGSPVEATVVPTRGLNGSKVFKGANAGERTYRWERLAGMNQRKIAEAS